MEMLLAILVAMDISSAASSVTLAMLIVSRALPLPPRAPPVQVRTMCPRRRTSVVRAMRDSSPAESTAILAARIAPRVQVLLPIASPVQTDST